VTGQVSTRVVVNDDGGTSTRHRTVLALSWDDSDPLAVRIVLSTEPDHPSLPRGEWVMLRDFLRYGCTEPTGDGAVRVRPEGDDRILLALQDETKTFEVRVPAATITGFLDETERAVPTGREAGEEVLDELIRRLLDR
jgi:Streptomyces sporulation and cell division protein, SsgA